MERRIVAAAGRAERGWLRFDGLDVELPSIEIASGVPGPRLAIMAGVHPNEVSSMEAALRLSMAFTEGLSRGSVDIIPVVNMPGLAAHAEFVVPVDGKNLNFSFPGCPEGSFTERLAHALVTEWSAGADVLIDLHGGDLREDVAKFIMVQMTGKDDFDARTRALARCFDADLIVEFEPGQVENSGRATNALPGLGRHAVMSEAGRNGRLDEDCVAFHVNGVLNLARLMGMTDGPPIPLGRTPRILTGFSKIAAPVAGRFYCEVECGEHVATGQRLAVLRDIFGDVVAEVRADRPGRVVMKVTHNIVAAGEWILSIGTASGDP